MGQRGKRLVSTRGAAANGQEQVPDHPHRLDQRFRAADSPTPSAIKDQGPQGCGLKALGLLTERRQQRQDRPAVRVEHRLGRPAVGPPPGAKRVQECGVWWWWPHHERRGDPPNSFPAGDNVAGAQKKMAMAPTGIMQALARVPVVTERLERVHIDRLDGESGVLCPWREVVSATPQVADTAWWIPTLLPPEQERLERRTCGASVVLRSRERFCERDAQQAALLRGRP
jgi:hypothetical protein